MQEDQTTPDGPSAPGGDAQRPAATPDDAPVPPPPAPPPPPDPASGGLLPPPAYPASPQAPAYQGWVLPANVVAGPRIDVASVLGRTFDTFGREWSLFLVLAVPAAVASLLQMLITPTVESQVQNRFAAAPDTTDPWALFVVSVIVATAVGISALASVVAADRLWRGEPAGIGDTIRGVIRSIPRAIPLWLLVVLVQVGVVLFTVAVLPAMSARPTAAATGQAAALTLIVLPIALVIGFAFVAIQVRLSLALPVVALEEGTPGSVIPRTWRVTRGHMIALFACSLVIGLCVSVTAWGATLFLLFGDNRVVAGIALAIAELVTAPLTGIWVLIAWGDLVGAGRHHDSELMARGKGRWTTVAIVFGLGTILLVAGLGVTGAAVTRIMAAP